LVIDYWKFYNNAHACAWNARAKIEDLEDRFLDVSSDSPKKDEDFIGKYVKVVSTDKTTYMKEDIVGRHGKVDRLSSGNIGVIIDGMRNEASSYGVYWFKKEELRILDEESEELMMKGYNEVAIVNLVEDYNKKDYGFALFEYESKQLVGKENALVVVNPCNKDRRSLAVVKEVVPAEEYERTHKHAITAQVVGVVDMDGYTARVNEEIRLKELAEKKAAIEKELEAEINKRKSIEYYEKMAQQYNDNPKLAALVAELKDLGM
jgi:flagellar biosynthesis/type III secretory pathway chaperone